MQPVRTFFEPFLLDGGGGGRVLGVGESEPGPMLKFGLVGLDLSLSSPGPVLIGPLGGGRISEVALRSLWPRSYGSCCTSGCPDFLTLFFCVQGARLRLSLSMHMRTQFVTLQAWLRV